MNISKRIIKNIHKSKAELREGIEYMQDYHDPNQPYKELLRFWFKGSAVKFVIAERTRQQEEIDGVRGWRFEIIADNSRAVIWYEAFQRFDGVTFFLGESDTQSVDKSQRNLEEIRANRFN